MKNISTSLRDLFEQPGIVRIVGAHNALGAKLAEEAGFNGVWSSGLEISTSYAVPDANILTMSEYLAMAQSMADAVQIPIVADTDTGYGNSNNVISMVRKFEAAGISAVSIEDKQFPKVNSFVAGRQDLAPIAEFVGKIMAAKNAQKTSEFMVIARVEALIAGWGQEEALLRAHAYVEAGADAILIHSKDKTPDQIVEFIKAWDSSAPLVVVPTTYPMITAQELEDLGVKMVIYANQGLRASVKAMLDTYNEILTSGSTVSIEEKIAPMSTIFHLQGMPQMKELEAIYVRTGMKRTRAIIPAAGDHMAEHSMKHIMSDIPITMLDVNGKPLLQRQQEILNRCGVGDVTVVGGYRAEGIDVEGVKLEVNSEWQTTGELVSIMQAASSYDGRTLIGYADILFDEDTLKKLFKSDDDITLLVDRTADAKNYKPDRDIDFVVVDGEIADSPRRLDLGTRRRVTKIGKSNSPQDINYEFAGLVLISEKGLALLRELFEEIKDNQNGKFQEANSIQNASLTDLLQEVIDRGHEINCVEVSSGWMEIRSFDDYRLACQVVIN